MKNKNTYRILPKYLLRTPIFSLDYYERLTREETISNEKFEEICNDKIVQESIFLASPVLFETLMKWLKGDLKDITKEEKFKNSLLKYITRMSTRCTPFGIFAGCSVGELSSENNITLDNTSNHKKKTRLDMNYLVNLAKNLSEVPFIKQQLKFYSNSSIYKIGNQIRYVEYHYSNNNRHHNISSISNSEYLDLVLDSSKEGVYLADIVNLLIPYDFSEDEILEFIDELVTNQILISELEPSVAGIDFLQQIINTLKKIEKSGELLTLLKTIQEKINNLDSSFGKKEEDYKELISYLRQINVDFESKYQFQTDMQLTTITNKIDKKIEANILKGFKILNMFNSKNGKSNLTDFRDAFNKRYEEKTMDLSYVLDPEVGIGYLQNLFIGHGDNNPLIDDLILDSNSNKTSANFEWSLVNNFFKQKLDKAISNNDFIIQINSIELNDFNMAWDDLPDTMSTIIEVVNNDGNEKFYINDFGHSSASNLLSRFSYNDNEIIAIIEDLVKIEDELNRDKILAEILHLPEDRAGNIIMRPSFRKYEIPYLSKSNLPVENQISIDDLQISVQERERIVLTSKKHKKEIKPHLSNAHNYIFNSLPIYHFLCDLQNQNTRNLGFDVFPFEHGFIPRIEYENIILQKATWNFKIEDIKILKKCLESENLLLSLDEFRKSKKMPKLMSLVDGDNELLINFKNISCARMLFDIVKDKTKFKMIEFLFTDKSQLVENTDGEKFTNQLIFSLYNKYEVEC